MDVVIHVTENMASIDNLKVLPHIRKILRRLSTTKREFNPQTKTMKYLHDKDFYVLDKEKNVLKFHIGFIPDLYRTLKQSGINVKLSIERRDVDKYLPFSFRSDYSLRDNQPLYFENCMRIKDGGRVLIDLVTGGGKTLLSIYLASKLSGKICLFLSPKYAEQWQREIKHLLQIDDDVIYNIAGRDSLVKLLNMSKDELDKYKVFNMSNDTLRNFLKAPYMVEPEELLEHIGVQNFIVDEVHEKTFMVSDTILRLNPYRVIALSATFVGGDANQEYINRVIFPLDKRANFNIIDKYITLTLVDYKLKESRRIKTDTVYGFNNKLYYASIMKIDSLRESMFKVNIRMLMDKYLADYEEGDKCLVFMPTIDAVSEFAEYLDNLQIENRFRRKLKVGAYKAGGKLEAALLNDIIVSTPGKAATGLDVKGLTVVVSNVNVGSIKLNAQILGRLRKFGSRVLTFVQLYSSNIEKTKQYLENLKSATKNKVETVEEIELPIETVDGSLYYTRA